ncbi:MAG: site-specific DNA-methyltransferase, partial [Prevotella sp.]|nr:site-specific DNA-methyltransferase [Prevotella sp.]
MQRATRNKTLTVSEQEIPLLESHISSAEELAHGFRDDMIVNGDLQDCLDSLPDGHFDLIIVDPPYNLDKNFHGRRFAAMKSGDYEEYLRSWFHKLCDKLRP